MHPAGSGRFISAQLSCNNTVGIKINADVKKSYGKVFKRGTEKS
jgi:hypothetical protein